MLILNQINQYFNRAVITLKFFRAGDEQFHKTKL